MTAEPRAMGTFAWHNTAQFLGALNDNLFKLLIIYGMTAALPTHAPGVILAMVGAVFALPFLLFVAAAGILADRLPKNRIVVGVKLLEVGVMAFGCFALWSRSPGMMLSAVFLMSTQSALFSPSKYGILPELVGAGNLSRANSYLQAASYLAIILGTASAPELSLALSGRLHLVGLVCVVLAVLGLLAAMKIQATPAAGATSRVSAFFLRDILRTLKSVRRDGFLNLAVWAGAFFLLIGAYVQLNVLTYGREHLGMAGEEQATRLFLLTALGIGAGSLFAGKVSKRGIEFGIVPIGALFMTCAAFGLWWIPPGAVTAAKLLMLLMGFGAGMFIVPVESFLQWRSPPEKVGEVVAASGWLSWVGVLISSGLLYLNTSVLGLSAAQGFLLLAGLILVLTAFSLLRLPDFFLRFLALVFTRTWYRIHTVGMERVPSQGSALLVCNHVSMMDAFWIVATQQRRVRFIMSRTYLSENCGRLTQAVLRLGKVITLHESDSPRQLLKSFAEAREAMDAGFLVCIFAEGHFSRTGHLLPFKAGFERIVKGTEYPILPLYIAGGFGSAASLVEAKPRMFSRRDFGRRITLACGAPLAPGVSAPQVRAAVEEAAVLAAEAQKALRPPVGRLFVRCARRHARCKALADSAGRELSYRRTLIAATLLRNRLGTVLEDDPPEIGVLLPPSVPAALVNLALTLDQRVAVNLNYTASRSAMASAIEQSGMQTLITSRKVLDKLGEIPQPRRLVYVEDLLEACRPRHKALAWLQAMFLPAACLVRRRGWTPDHPLTILFSSGSTAEPKGVVLSHHNVCSNIEAFSVVARAIPSDNICGILPFFHSFGYTATLWFPLLNGFSAVYHHNPVEAETIGKLTQRHQSTILVATPTFLTAFLRKVKPEQFRSLRWVVTGAEKLRPQLADLFESRFGIRPIEGYGATECSPVVCVSVPDCTVDGLQQVGTRSGSVGRPLPGVLVRIVNPETGEELPPDSEGLLRVKGPNVMRGYLNRPEATAEVLRDGWYDTGDVARVDAEGFVTLTDRLSRFSKIAGEMVSHTAVEHALQEAIDCPPDALAVTGIPDERKGERLVALVTPAAGELDDIRRSVAAADLPNLWKPAPGSWKVVEALPTLGSGKLDLRTLREWAAQGE